MRKFFAVLLAGVLAFSLVACDGGTEIEKEEQQQEIYPLIVKGTLTYDEVGEAESEYDIASTYSYKNDDGEWVSEDIVIWAKNVCYSNDVTGVNFKVPAGSSISTFYFDPDERTSAEYMYWDTVRDFEFNMPIKNGKLQIAIEYDNQYYKGVDLSEEEYISRWVEEMREKTTYLDINLTPELSRSVKPMSLNEESTEHIKPMSGGGPKVPEYSNVTTGTINLWGLDFTYGHAEGNTEVYFSSFNYQLVHKFDGYMMVVNIRPNYMTGKLAMTPEELVALLS